MDKQETICLIDGSGYIFRAFYALPMMTRSDGTPVNAVYGFLNMLLNLSNENHCSHIVVIFDAARRNFRNTIFPDYKATRKETPAELIPQFPLIRQACQALNISCIEMDGYEADDLIATYARLAVEKGWTARVISADKDLMQLMRENVSLYDPMKKKTLSADDVFAKFGVTPDKVVDVQALMGDSTDNVPGANGIGPKTASELINTYGSIEELFNHIDEIKSEKRRLGLIRDKEQVFISKQLVQLDNHVPINQPIEDFKSQKPIKQTLLEFVTQNEFKSLTAKISKWADDDISTPTSETAVNQTQNNKPFSYKIINKENELNALIKGIKQSTFAFRIYTDSKNLPVSASIALNQNEGYYVILSNEAPSQTLDLFSFDTIQNKGIPVQSFIQELLHLCKEQTNTVISYNIKNQWHILDSFLPDMTDIPLCDDIMIANYVLNGTNISYQLGDMISYYLNDNDGGLTPLLGSGKNKIAFENLPIEEVARICTKEATQLLKLYHILHKNITNNPQKQNIYNNIERPLIPILFEMERKGILIDKNHLTTLNDFFTQEINRLINIIYELAGEEFNINSPVQVGHILFDKLELASGKKTSTGNYATDVKTLTALADDGVEIAQKILEYRLYVKLKSTYIDSLTTLADKNNRVHTTFLQTGTNTGRLSSVDPNLQNIPIKTNAGKEIRKAFVAKKGYKLVCADYSQIELRLMADVAEVKELQNSFRLNEDIHARTASQIFKIPLNHVDTDTRRRAKAINFGIIYGMSAFGLASQLGISRTDAKKYIDAYFTHYPEIQEYMKNTTQQVLENGFVQTPMGRQCFIQGANSPQTKSFAVRAGINAPIQGGAADIIKLAMIAVFNKIKESNLDASLLLQVHDELVFEVKESDVAQTMQLVKETMENIVQLSVPLIVEVESGNNWKEAH